MASTTCSGNFNFRPSAKDLFSASTISSSTLTASSVVSRSSPVGAAYVIVMKKAVVGIYISSNPLPEAMSDTNTQENVACSIVDMTFELPNHSEERATPERAQAQGCGSLALEEYAQVILN